MAINEKEIYDYILENIIQIENDLKSNSNDEQVNSEKKSAVKIIEEFRKNRLEKLIYELKNNLRIDLTMQLIQKIKAKQKTQPLTNKMDILDIQKYSKKSLN